MTIGNGTDAYRFTEPRETLTCPTPLTFRTTATRAPDDLVLSIDDERVTLGELRAWLKTRRGTT